MSRKTCPICREQMPAPPRYPNQVCQACARRTCDEDGHPLRFHNVSLSGGFVAKGPIYEEATKHPAKKQGEKRARDQGHYPTAALSIG